MALEFPLDAFTPRDVQPLAVRVGLLLEADRYSVRLEAALAEDAPYRTTLLARLGDFTLLVEVQAKPAFTAELERLSAYLDRTRAYGGLYVAIEASEEAPVSGRMLQQLKRYGVGLKMVSDSERLETSFEARVPALVVTPDPTLTYGRCRGEVNSCLKRFNEGDRRGALRDLFELAERETAALARKAARRGWIDPAEAVVDAMRWADQINVLASADRTTHGRAPLITPTLKDDLHSFRGARNLIDHPARTRRADLQRQRQFSERMAGGPRLISELIRLQRRIS